MQTQIQRIKDAKEAMRLSIIAKGVDVPISAKIDTYPSYIAQIVRTTQHATFAVTDDITQYTSTEFVDVFDRATGNWYKLNNLNQFEQYGVYGTSPDGTKYVGKLIVYNGNEYEWTGSDWKYLGQVEGESHTSDFTTQDIINVIQTDVSVLEDGMYLSILPYSLKGQISNSKALLGSSDSDRLSNLFSYTNVETIADSDIIDRSVWKLYSTGDADTYYVQNVATGKYFGYESVNASKSLPLVDETNKVPVKFVVFTVNNVTAIGICKSGTPNDGYAINNLYSYNNRYNWYNTIASAEDLNNSFVIYKINSSYAVYPKEYAAIAIPTPPPTQVTFNTMEEALGYSYVYYGLRAAIDDKRYIYNSNNEWEEITYAITGVKVGSGAMSLRINGNKYDVEVLSPLYETNYKWAIDWDPLVPITSVRSNTGAADLVNFDLSKSDTSQWTALDNQSFYNCTSLTLSELPDSIEYVGSSSFYGCTSLASMSMQNVTRIGDDAFYGCTSLASVSMPNVTRIGIRAFDGCTSLASVSMPKATTIENYAFYHCSKLVSADMPNVTTIGNYAFMECHKLVSPDMSNITSIGFQAFGYCTSLGTISMPKVTTIDGAAFLGSGITSVSAPSITSIGGSAFYNCTSLATADISNVETIGSEAFSLCSSLASIDIPNVTSIAEKTFYKCGSLTTALIPSVTTIGSQAFYSCSLLTSIDLSNVTSIGYSAFSGCTSLASVSIPNVTEVLASTFANCSSLASVYTPSVTAISNYAFQGCKSLTSVDMPSSVNNIGDDAFYNCTSLASVICRATTPPNIGTDIFKYCSSNLVIYVPAGSVEAYKTATNWSSYASKIKAISE